MRKRTTRIGLPAAAVAAALWLWAPAARAESSEGAQAGSDFGIGVVTVLGNIGYMPVKVCYALLGGVTGSLAYALTGGDREVAEDIWGPSMGGDYVLTTDMMSGEEQVRFSGLRSGAASGAASAAREETVSEAADGEDESPAAGAGSVF